MTYWEVLAALVREHLLVIAAAAVALEVALWLLVGALLRRWRQKNTRQNRGPGRPA